MIDLGTLPVVRFVSDLNTPEHLQQFSNWRLILGPGVTPPAPGSFDTLKINGVTVPGFLREGTGEWEWVMQAAIDPVVAALEAIPGPDGWQSASARAVYQSVGGQMLAAGVELTAARTILTSCYNGAVENFVTAHPQTP